MTPRLELILWMAGCFGNGVLFFVLLLKKHWQRFPVFTSIAAYEVVRSLILFLISRVGSHTTYVHVYWTSEFLDVALQVALLFEIGRTVVLAGHAIQRPRLRQPVPLYKLGFAIFIAFLCALALPTATNTEETLDMRACLFTSVLTCELYLLILRRLNRLQLEQCRNAMVISKGICAWSTCVLLSDLIHELNGWQNHAIYFDEFRSVIVVTMLVYWSAFFWRASPKLRRTTWFEPASALAVHAYVGDVDS